MNHAYFSDGYRIYTGMKLRHNPCDVFIDNPLFSEIIFDNPVNSGNSKTWGRFVRQSGQANAAFVPEQPGTWKDYDRLNNLYRRKSGQDFDALWGGWRAVEQATDWDWLVCEPRDEILRYWYDTDLESWRQQIAETLTRLGHTYQFRPKPIRRHRVNNITPRVIHIAPQYRGVITAHSVSAIDSLLAGRPAVVWGQDPTCGCATPWQEFETAGQVRRPSLDQIQNAACTWAATTHKLLESPEAIKCIMK
jgi:hypothetical protein